MTHIEKNIEIPLTRSLVNEWLPKNLANLVIAYFQTTSRKHDDIIMNGNYEAVMLFESINVNKGLKMSCHVVADTLDL